MAWSQQTITDTASFGQTWTDVVASLQLNPRELVHFQIKADNQSGTITDAMEIRVLSSTDGSTWDDTPIFALSYEPATIGAEYVAFILSGYRYVRVQAQSAGATDNYISGGFYALDGVSA